MLYLALAMDANTKEEWGNLRISTMVMSTQATSLARIGEFRLAEKSSESVLRSV